MFFKSKKPEPIKEDSRIKDLQITTRSAFGESRAKIRLAWINK